LIEISANCIRYVLKLNSRNFPSPVHINKQLINNVLFFDPSGQYINLKLGSQLIADLVCQTLNAVNRQNQSILFFGANLLGYWLL